MTSKILISALLFVLLLSGCSYFQSPTFEPPITKPLIAGPSSADYSDLQPPAPHTHGTVSVIEQDLEIIEAWQASAELEPSDLVGDWQVIQGDFESITLEADNTFSSFLHDRPFLDGQWIFSQGALTLNADSGDDLVYQYQPVSSESDRLNLYSGEAGEQKDIWQRIK